MNETSESARQRYVVPAWVEEKMLVYLLWDREKGTGLRCEVVMAAGNSARVVNELHKVDRWVALDDLRVPESDSHTHAALSRVMAEMAQVLKE